MTALAADADYLGVGPIFTTQGKADAGAPIGTQFLSDLSSRYTTPLVAIGGINSTNARAVIAAGAAGVAVITAVVNAEDIVAAARSLSEVWEDQ